MSLNLKKSEIRQVAWKTQKPPMLPGRDLYQSYYYSRTPPTSLDSCRLRSVLQIFQFWWMVTHAGAGFGDVAVWVISASINKPSLIFLLVTLIRHSGSTHWTLTASVVWSVLSSFSGLSRRMWHLPRENFVTEQYLRHTMEILMILRSFCKVLIYTESSNKFIQIFY